MSVNAKDALPWSAAAFEARFHDDPDPWHFRTSPWERARYRKTLSWLQRPQYRSALEPGCANGELTARLAPHCDRLLAFDVSPSALRAASDRCRRVSGAVRFECEDLSTFYPNHQRFDLLVLSEVGYYFSAELLRTIVHRMSGALDPGSELLAVHWLGHSVDHRLHGDDVHTIIDENRSLSFDGGERCGESTSGFRIDRWSKA